MKEILSLNHLASLLSYDKDFIQIVAKESHTYYRPYEKRQLKKDGTFKLRIIEPPSCPLKDVQRRINSKILRPHLKDAPSFVTGSVKGRGIKDNLTPHVGKQVVVGLDIKDCFPSINRSMIYRSFRRELACSPSIAKVLTKLVSFRGHLPQGSPSSSSVCNLVLLNISRELEKRLRDKKVSFSQYVDDLTSSGDTTQPDKIIAAITGRLRAFGLRIERKKINIQRRNTNQTVTGGVVNNRPSVGRSKLKAWRRGFLRGEIPVASYNGLISHVTSINRTQAEYLRRAKIKLRVSPS